MKVLFATSEAGPFMRTGGLGDVGAALPLALSCEGVDVRVIVIGGKTVASMERRNKDDFRSNVAQGGCGVKIDLPENFQIVAESCAEILGLDYCGVDLLYGNDGEPYVCEVNSNAFFGGIEEATGVNVAKLYAEHIIKTIYK